MENTRVNLNNYTIYQLRLLARQHRLGTYRRTKSELQEQLLDIHRHSMEHDAACIIQKCFRRWARLQPSNTHCPITMEPFDGITCYFDYITPNGQSVIRFDANALYKYFMTTFTTVNPVTNTPLHYCELLRLDRSLRAACGPDIVGVAESSVNFPAKRELMIQQHSIVQYLTSEVDDAVRRCCTIAERDNQTLGTGIYELRREYGSLVRPIEELVRCDKEAAVSCIMDNISYVKDTVKKWLLLQDDIVDFLRIQLALIKGVMPFFGIPNVFAASFLSSHS